MPKKKKKRKLSAYNKFVKKYFEDHSTATMEKAAAAWKNDQKKKNKRPNRKKGKKAPSKRRNVNKTVRRKKNRNRSRKSTFPIAILVPFIASFFIKASSSMGSIYSAIQSKNYPLAATHAIRGWLGYNTNTHSFEGIPPFMTLMVIGGAGHKVAGALGINQALGQARVPYLRV